MDLNLMKLVKSRELTFFVIPAPHQVRDKLRPESCIYVDRRGDPFDRNHRLFHLVYPMTFSNKS